MNISMPTLPATTSRTITTPAGCRNVETACTLVRGHGHREVCSADCAECASRCGGGGGEQADETMDGHGDEEDSDHNRVKTTSDTTSSEDQSVENVANPSSSSHSYMESRLHFACAIIGASAGPTVKQGFYPVLYRRCVPPRVTSRSRAFSSVETLQHDEVVNDIYACRP
jgi:hypothetical protein